MLKSRAYIILGFHKKTGQIVGVDWNGRITANKSQVRTVDYSTYGKVRKVKGAVRMKDSCQKEWNIQATYASQYSKQNPEYEFKVFRVGSKYCPVKVSWDQTVKSNRNIMNDRKILPKASRLMKFSLNNICVHLSVCGASVD